MKTLQLFRSSLSRLAAVLFFGIVAFPADTWAETFTVGSLNYETNADGDNTVTVTGHVGDTNPTGTLTIPGSVDYGGITYTVTQIGEGAFSSYIGLTGDLTIPNSVKTIGDHAFSSCSGFTGNLTIGSSVKTIGDEAFRGCIGFTGSLTIGTSVETIGNNAFDSCIGLTGSLTIPNSVKTIGAYAFGDCKGLTGSLTIGTSVETIGAYAFCNCKGLTGSLTIPNSVKTIGAYAFERCSSFTGSLTIGTSVETIGDAAFNSCSGFTGSLTLPNSVKTIGKEAFYRCNSFTGSLTIGTSVETIGDAAFNSCSGFTGDLTIPNSVKAIGASAFYGCTNLESVLVHNTTPPILADNVFVECSSSLVFYVPTSALEAYQKDDQWSAYASVMKPIGYAVGLKTGTEDASSWSVTPSTDVKAGATVTITYSGTKSVRLVEAQTVSGTGVDVAAGTTANTWALTMPSAEEDVEIGVAYHQPVASVVITGIEAPSTLTALDTEAACTTTGVAGISVVWKNGSAPVSGIAIAGIAYTVEVTLRASADYILTAGTTATINGTSATVTLNTDGTLTASCLFAATTKLTPAVSAVPTATAVTYGQTLAASTLSGGETDTEGSFAWTAPTTAPVCADSGTTGFEVTFTPVDATNYATVTTTVTLTVNKKTLTITAESKSKTYAEADPPLTYISEGLLDGDAITGALARDPGEAVGTYAILQGTLTAGDNYTIRFTGASLTIMAAHDQGLTVVVTDEDRHEAGIVGVTLQSGQTALTLPTSVTIGGKSYTLTSIAGDVLKGLTQLTDIYLPDTGAPLSLGSGALTIDGTHAATVHAPLPLLDDYALSAALHEHVRGGRLKATVTPSTEYWTFSCGVDVRLPEGVSLYKCRLMSGGTSVALTRIAASALDGVIKACNGVLVRGTAGRTYDIVVSPDNRVTSISTADAKSYGADNQLEPVIEPRHYASAHCYVLKDGCFHTVLDNASEVPACKAVLRKPAGQSASRSLGLEGDDTTGVPSVSADAPSDQWYDLRGRRVAQPTRKGLYVRNGRVVIVK